MGDGTNRDADAAKLAALYQRAEEAGKAFTAYMEASMPLWQAVVDARKERDAFRREYRAAHMSMTLKPKESE